MAEKLAELRQKGGGIPVASGTYTRGTSDATITCGFRPKKIILIHGNASATPPNGAWRNIYDSEWSTTYITNDYRNGSGVATVSNAVASNYLTITDTGFIAKGTTTAVYQGEVYYTAIG